MHITYETIGMLLQILGVVMVLVSQAFFAQRARKKHRRLPIAFLEIQAMRWGMTKEQIEETAKDKQKLKEAFNKFPLAARACFLRS